MYEINLSTLLLIGLDNESTKIVTYDDEFICNYSAKKIINNSCKFFGNNIKKKKKKTFNMSLLVKLIELMFSLHHFLI